MITSGTDFGVDCAIEEELTIDPMALVGMWTHPAEDAAPPLMALATIGLDGYPRVRNVLLSESDSQALYFHTDAGSEKCMQIALTPKGAVTLAWPTAGRQLAIHGDVTESDAEQQHRSYRKRSRYLQLLAWCNTAEAAHQPAENRRRMWAEFDATHEHLEPPTAWKGFALVPQEITFWRGDPDGPSRRVRFVREEAGSWSSGVLPG